MVNVNQIIIFFANNIAYMLFVVGIILIIVGLVEIDVPPLKLRLVQKISSAGKIMVSIGIVFILIGLPFEVITLFQTVHPTVVGKPDQTPTIYPTPVPSKKVSITPSPTSMLIDSNSSLIPEGQAPTINDPLKDNSQGYGWSTPTESIGSCSFTDGQYLLSAPGGKDTGIDCSTTSSTSIFGNFVYQIKMTILKGMDDTNASAVGPTFRLNTNNNGQEYEVSFDVDGDWQVQSDVKPLEKSGTSCNNPCSAFHAGVNQPNFITIRAYGSVIQVQINGQILGSFSDGSYASGFIGVDMAPGKNTSAVEFSDVRVWKL